MRRLKVLGVFLLAVGCTTGAGGQDDAGSGGVPGSPGSGGAGVGGQSTTSTGGGFGVGGETASASGGQPAAGQGGKAGGQAGGQMGSATGGQPASGGQAGGQAAGGRMMSSGGQSGAGSAGKPGSGGQGGTGGATGQGGGGRGGSSPSGGHTNPLSQTLIDEFVAAHNQARAGTLNPMPSPALPPVSWDALLADTAFNYLSKCQSADKSLVDHNANREADYRALGGKDYVGENIYATTAKTASPSEAVSLWMGEASSYNYATNSGNAGHYTQVVWRASVRIGCAIVNCPAVKFNNTVLCDYAPGGNYNGQKPY